MTEKRKTKKTETLGRSPWWAAALLAVAVAVACEFSPTAPFSGFDGAGSRVSGTFAGEGGSAAGLQAAPSSRYEGIVVLLREDPSLRTEVRANGTFVLAGLPAGTVTLVFEREGAVLGTVTLRDVLPNQEIRIVVVLTEADRVALVSESRDETGELGTCPRSPGFWCQNRDGQNPNLSRKTFEELAVAAGQAVFPDIADPNARIEAVERAVCDTSDQLLRHLVALALNLAAGLVDASTPLEGEPFATVGDAFDAGFAALSETDRATRNEIKDVLERINEGAALGGSCADDDEEDEEEEEEPVPSECPVGPDGKITICHRPPGNPSKPQTISISPSAWPAHKAHGDACGACS